MAGKRTYGSKRIRVSFERERCIHAEQCVRGLSTVFARHRRPWIDPEQGTPDEIARVVERCPTGALTYERLDGGAGEAAARSNTIIVSADGPLYVAGDVEIRHADGSPRTREFRAALCRCGASRHKPYCDGKHSDIDFRAPGDLGAGSVRAATDDTPDVLAVRPLRDGPLLLEGHFSLLSHDGSRELRGGRGSLCRCGASATKPLCDGSHARVGFASAPARATDRDPS